MLAKGTRFYEKGDLMNTTILSEYWPLFAGAAVMTLKISFWGILASMIVGILCALVRWFRIPVLKGITGFYIELSRNTPLLVQLFFLYFGLPKMGIRFSGEMTAIIGTAFLGGSYMAEAIRSGLEAVPEIQRESAESLGMSGLQTLRYVILPEAFSISLPAITANILFLIKETSVVSGIAVPDLMYTAKDLIGNDYNTTEALFVLVMWYLIILVPVDLLARYAEKRMRYGQ